MKVGNKTGVTFFSLKHKTFKGINSLVVQWFGLCAFTAEDMGLIPSQGPKNVPQATWHSKEKKKKKKIKCFKIHRTLFFKYLKVIQ